MSVDVVFFELRGRRCAVSVDAVLEVVPMGSITPVPLAPPGVEFYFSLFDRHRDYGYFHGCFAPFRYLVK